MIGDYKVNRCSRRCHAEDRPLREGEVYYSVVLESGDGYQRRDFAASSWSEPPEGTIGWWRSRMPKSSEKKMVLAPDAVLIDLLRQMANFPDKAASRYLMALMLMRRRVLVPVSSDDKAVDPNAGEDPASSTAMPGDSAAGDDVMTVEVVADGSRIAIPTLRISRSEADDLKEELVELLYCEAEEEEEPGE